MKITLEQLAAATPADLTIHSLDLALYQVTVNIDGQARLLEDNTGKPIRHRSLQKVREMLRGMPVRSLVLRHESAYDEMIGQPTRDESNALEVSLALDIDPPPTIH